MGRCQLTQLNDKQALLFLKLEQFANTQQRQAKLNHYKVLARSYRPQTFDALIGQDALVQILTNAISSNRIPHAFMLSGPRGVGKTTTARLIARALNCADGPTMTPCGTCDHCQKIAADSHIDVIEMDAASRTGVDDVRDLIEGVRYKPVMARYKVYIIDEVHMLSKHAFNAFLKTLEEPPQGVVFIFATTEIRKVPVTVLSRCMRFDLKLVPLALLQKHVIGVAQQEKVKIDEASALLLAQAGGGSVRDALSLLDQAIVFCESEVTTNQVVAMLGLADRKALYDLVAVLSKGQAAEALKQIKQFHDLGLDPKLLIQDLLHIVHFLTSAVIDKAILEDQTVLEVDRVEGQKIIEDLSVMRLGHLWQMLIKGLDELKIAEDPYEAIEMIAIRIAHLSTVPTPHEVTQAQVSEPAPQKVEILKPEAPPPKPKASNVEKDPLVRQTMAAFPDAQIM